MFRKLSLKMMNPSSPPHQQLELECGAERRLEASTPRVVLAVRLLRDATVGAVPGGAEPPENMIGDLVLNQFFRM